MTYEKMLKSAQKSALDNKKEVSAINLLFSHFTKKNIFDDLNEEVDCKIFDEFNKAISKYIDNNIPINYIIGYKNFYGYDFLVTRKCLIPRFETEELVERLIEEYHRQFYNEEVNVLDLGTGSGCIAITLKMKEEKMNLTAIDISKGAIDIAKKNAKRLNATVEFLKGDMFKPVLNRKFDILVSNPPYIKDNEEIDISTRKYEPHKALYGGEDGLYFYQNILANAKKVLNQKNIIAFEHGCDQGKAIRFLAEKYFKNAKTTLYQDMQGRDRITIIVNEG